VEITGEKWMEKRMCSMFPLLFLMWWWTSSLEGRSLATQLWLTEEGMTRLEDSMYTLYFFSIHQHLRGVVCRSILTSSSYEFFQSFILHLANG